MQGQSEIRRRGGAAPLLLFTYTLLVGACMRGAWTKATTDIAAREDLSVLDKAGALGDGHSIDGHSIDGHPIDAGWMAPGTWKAVPAGTFLMGSPSSEPCRYGDEAQHQVTLTKSFEIMTTEVTQGYFLDILGYNPCDTSMCGPNLPAQNINWHQAVAYCNALSSQRGLVGCYDCTGSGDAVTCSVKSAFSGQAIYSCPGYRLPTEAEWEYAYRAGSTTAFYSGASSVPANRCETDYYSEPNASSIGWYDNNSSNVLQPVAQKLPNSWGLYDMAGNIEEWCHDPYQQDLGSSPVTDPVNTGTPDHGVMRGGSYYGFASNLRAAYRYDGHQWSSGFSDDGFRCVRSSP